MPNWISLEFFNGAASELFLIQMLLVTPPNFPDPALSKIFARIPTKISLQIVAGIFQVSSSDLSLQEDFMVDFTINSFLNPSNIPREIPVRISKLT